MVRANATIAIKCRRVALPTRLGWLERQTKGSIGPDPIRVLTMAFPLRMRRGKTCDPVSLLADSVTGRHSPRNGSNSYLPTAGSGSPTPCLFIGHFSELL